MNKDVKELIELVTENGFNVITAGKHYKILDSSKTVVVDKDGPLMIPGTPSSPRWRDNTVSRLRKAGVLTSDNGSSKKKTAQTALDDEKLKRREKEEAAQRERQARTKIIRERIEVLVVSMGGWEKKGTQSHLAGAFYHFATLNGFTVPASHNSSQMMVHTLRRGSTLATPSAEVWESFLNIIESKPDPAAEILNYGKSAPETEPVKVAVQKSAFIKQEERNQVLALHDAGANTSAIARTVYGSDSGSRRNKVSEILKSGSTPATTAPKREGRKPSGVQELEFLNDTRTRLNSIIFQMVGSSSTNAYRQFWLNGMELTRPGDPYPGEKGKTSAGEQMLGIDHVRRVSQGRVKTIKKAYHQWWETNLLDCESGTVGSTSEQEPELSEHYLDRAKPTSIDKLLTEDDFAVIREESSDATDGTQPEMDTIGPWVASELVHIPPRTITVDQTPTLALRALAMMLPRPAQNAYDAIRSDPKEADTAVQVAREILAMEINDLLAGDAGEGEER